MIKSQKQKIRRVNNIFARAHDHIVAVGEGAHAVEVLEPAIKERLHKSLEDFGFSPIIDKDRVVEAYVNHLNQRGDPLGLLLSEFDHMVEAMYTARDIMAVGPASFSEHRDAIGLGALFHDIYDITMKGNVNDVTSLSDYLTRNYGHEQEKGANLPIIREVARAAVDSDELYQLVVDAVDFSSGRHKMSESNWRATQWIYPMRMADNISTQRTYGDRHKFLAYNWACDAVQGVEPADKIAKRIQRREGFCQRANSGDVRSLVQEQVLERKGINLEEEFPGLMDRFEQAGGFRPVILNPITAYATALQIAYNGELNQLIPEFGAVGYDRAAYTLRDE